MDSILKNVTGAGNYKEHIEKIVYKVFLHVFETVSFLFSTVYIHDMLNVLILK